MSSKQIDLRVANLDCEHNAAIIKNGLRFYPAYAAREIEQFIRREVARLDKRGVVLGLSGGLDSTVCAYLCVRALGRGRVLAFILPKRDSDPQNARDAEMVAQTLVLRATQIDLTPILTQLGIYDLVSKERAGDRRAIEAVLHWITRVAQQPSPFSEGLALLYNANPSRGVRLTHKLLWQPVGRIHAFAITKVRLRMLVLYYHVIRNGALGSTINMAMVRMISHFCATCIKRRSANWRAIRCKS